jgi:hypothetical protein
MYIIEMRFYVVMDDIHAAAEYRSDYQGKDEVLARTSLKRPRSGYLISNNHNDIVSVGRLLCDGIARQLDVPLF